MPTLFQRKQATTVAEAYHAMRLAHVQFLFSGLTYIVVAWLLRRNVPGAEHGFVDLPASQYNPLLYLAFVISLAAAVLLFAYIIPRHTLLAPAQQENVNTLPALLKALQQTHLLRIVIADIPAILGLVLFLLNGQMEPLVSLVGVTWLLLLVTFPRREDWEEAEQVFRRRFPPA